MKLLEGCVADGVQVSPEYLFLPANDELTAAIVDVPADKIGARQIANLTLSQMGLSERLQVGEREDDAIMKMHDTVSKREAAVAEQFFHADVAVNGFAGILLIGLEGRADSVPETQTVNNASMAEYITHLVWESDLEERSDDILVVRPYRNPADDSEWLNYPRHVLTRLAREPYRHYLTNADQLAHVDTAIKAVADRSKYVGEIFTSKLLSHSLIDGTPLVSCGVSSREIRLALKGGHNCLEAEELSMLHQDITEYLLDETIVHHGQKVVQGSALFVPKDQLHRATPYLAKHRRSVAAVKCYPQPGQTPPASWQRAPGTEY